MRNLKKILALVLALVMTFSVMATANAFTDDKNIDATYDEAVAVLTGLGVFKGFEDGSFGPKGTITRAQVAAIIYRIVTGDVTDAQVGIYADYNKFSDVAANSWYAGYVNFCANAQYILGNGDGTFKPDAPVTGYAALAMIQRAMGYDKNGEFTGAGWEVRTASNAQALGMLKNIKAGTLGAAATREVVAEILFQAIQLPTVNYTLAFGYRASGDALIAKFNAEKVEGIIVDTLASKGQTTFEADKKTVTVKKTEADWTNVGYAGFVWAVKGNAITKTFITGVELGSSNDGTSYADLTNSKKDAYIAAGIEKPALFEDGAKVNAIDNGIGANLSLVDNDGDGKVDTLVNVTYDVAKVTNVTRISKSGVVTDYSYSLDTNKVVYPDDLANVDSLTKGDYIAYTVVDDEYYVTVLSADKGEFEYIDSTELKAETVKCYSIAGTEYVVSEMDGVATNGQLLKSNINNDVIFVTDMFGYIVRVEAPKADPNDYLYVIDNEHSKVLTGLAETYIANVDGSVDTVNVKDKTLTHSKLADKIFTYTVKNGAYVLGAAEYVTLNVAAYETYEVSMTGIADLSETTIVDLRDVLAAKAEEGTVYVGYTEIPSFVDGKILYIPEIDLGFMTAGKAPAAAGVAVEYVVFNTAANVIDRVKVNGVYENTYELKAGVLIKGELVADYVLSQDEKDNVDTFGVGVYSYDKNGVLTYTSFAENTEVMWTPESNGTVIYKNVDVVAADTYEIIILDISAGKIGAWSQLVVEGNYFSYIDEKNDIMYVVGDAPVLTTATKSILAVAGAAGTGAVNGANEYWAANKKVTAYAEIPAAPVVTYDTAEPTVTIAGKAVAKGATLTLTYAEYAALTAGVAPVVVTPAQGNSIAIKGETTFVTVAVETELALKPTAGEAATITIYSQGNAEGAVTKSYSYKATWTAAQTGATLVSDGDDTVVTAVANKKGEIQIANGTEAAYKLAADSTLATVVENGNTVTVTSEDGETTNEYTIVEGAFVTVNGDTTFYPNGTYVTLSGSAYRLTRDGKREANDWTGTQYQIVPAVGKYLVFDELFTGITVNGQAVSGTYYYGDIIKAADFNAVKLTETTADKGLAEYPITGNLQLKGVYKFIISVDPAVKGDWNFYTSFENDEFVWSAAGLTGPKVYAKHAGWTDADGSRTFTVSYKIGIVSATNQKVTLAGPTDKDGVICKFDMLTVTPCPTADMVIVTITNIEA